MEFEKEIVLSFFLSSVLFGKKSSNIFKVSSFHLKLSQYCEARIMEVLFGSNKMQEELSSESFPRVLKVDEL